MILRKKSARIKELEKKICKVRHQLEIEQNKVMTELKLDKKLKFNFGKENMN